MTLESTHSLGHVTYSEILGQCSLWPDTVSRVRAHHHDVMARPQRPLFTGAGTSAYAASAITASWNGAQAVPTTDLLVAPTMCDDDRDCLVSIARSGSSPESVGAVRRIQQMRPSLRQLAILCNGESELARMPSVETIVLDPRTNDRALAMTGSFSNLVLAGLTLRHGPALAGAIDGIRSEAERLLPALEAAASRIAQIPPSRAVLLASAPLVPLAREAALKITELTGGAISTVTESFLGLRHGPMSYLRRDTLVVCFLSSDAYARQYELDLIEELRRKQLGRIVHIGAPGWSQREECIAAVAGHLPDALRTPFEALFPQMLAFHLSLRCGLDPDEPSPNGVIHRVVRGVQLYDA